jgi:replication-associated recombination protein RarA
MSFELKYAPTKFSDIVISDSYVIDELSGYISGVTKRPIILHGSYGVGKTTIANLLPDAIEGVPVMVDKIKAIEFRTAADVTKAIQISPFTGSLLFRYTNGQLRQYVVTNELTITDNAAKALVDLIDDHYEKVQFIFTTNEIHTVDRRLRSRSTVIEITAATPEAWLPRAQFIMENEGFEFEEKLLLKAISDQLVVSSDHRELLKMLERLVRQCNA